LVSEAFSKVPRRKIKKLSLFSQDQTQFLASFGFFFVHLQTCDPQQQQYIFSAKSFMMQNFFDHQIYSFSIQI